MISTSVCVVRPPKADLDRVARGVGILSRATRKVFSRVFQRGGDAAQTKREVCAEEGASGASLLGLPGGRDGGGGGVAGAAA